jgi:hypothetical protein
VEVRANRIEVLPAERVVLDLPGQSQQVAVLAHYPDGQVRDVTREAIVTSSDIDLLSVADTTVTALRRGEASILVRYEGAVSVWPLNTSVNSSISDNKSTWWAMSRPQNRDCYHDARSLNLESTRLHPRGWFSSDKVPGRAWIANPPPLVP